MSRAEDFLIQSLIKGAPQLWETGWAERFHRAPANPMDNGFGFTADQVAAFQLPAVSGWAPRLLPCVERDKTQSAQQCAWKGSFAVAIDLHEQPSMASCPWRTRW